MGDILGMESVRKLFTDGHQLPTVRLHQVELTNFKSVRHGEIIFDCARSFVPYGTKSDILGIYGQNGSGKTAFIEALAILQMVLSGEEVSGVFCDCIRVDSDHSELSFLFDFQYPNGDVRKLTYAFSLRSEMRKKTSNSRYPSDDEGSSNKLVPCAVVYDEKIWIDGIVNGKALSLKEKYIDTSDIDENSLWAPKSKRSLFIEDFEKVETKLIINKSFARRQSTSFIFMEETVEMLRKDKEAVFAQMLLELQYFAEYFFFVISTKSSGFIRLNLMIPFSTPHGVIPFHLDDDYLVVSEESFSHVKAQIDTASNVLSALVPGLKVDIRNRGNTTMKDGTPSCYVELISSRADDPSMEYIDMPFRYESDGIRKLFSCISLLIFAYNQQSVTVAIDEFDAGIFEYLLGEILNIFEESGKGQFIFTSHNLRPLEVISRKFIVFTTTNPDNRYYRLKGISSTSNLRSTYFREILLGEQDEEIYNQTKTYKIVSALRKADVLNI